MYVEAVDTETLVVSLYIYFSGSCKWAYVRTTCDCNAISVSTNYIAVFVFNILFILKHVCVSRTKYTRMF
jgi:hypothetical protein